MKGTSRCYCYVLVACCSYLSHPFIIIQPSVAEKKTLEIAHTFLDEGKTPTVKLRAHEHSSPNPATVRRTDSDRTYTSPSQQVCVTMRQLNANINVPQS